MDKACPFRSSEMPVQMDRRLSLHVTPRCRWETKVLFIWMRSCGQVPTPVTGSRPAGGHWGSGCGGPYTFGGR